MPQACPRKPPPHGRIFVIYCGLGSERRNSNGMICPPCIRIMKFSKGRCGAKRRPFTHATRLSEMCGSCNIAQQLQIERLLSIRFGDCYSHSVSIAIAHYTGGLQHAHFGSHIRVILFQRDGRRCGIGTCSACRCIGLHF